MISKFMTKERLREHGKNDEVSELDEFLGPKEEKIAVQEKLLALPTFAQKELLEETPPKIVRVKISINKEKKKDTATSTSISDIGVYYPYILAKEKKIDDNLPEWHHSVEANKAANIGLALHSADALINCVISGAQGKYVDTFFPTFKPDQRLPIIEAIGKIETDEDGEISFDTEMLMNIWRKYVQNQIEIENTKTSNLTLEGYGIDDAKDKLRFYQGEEVESLVEMLANAWLEEILNKEKAPLTWEFEKGTVTQREIMVVDNMKENKLQFKTRLDSATRKVNERKKVVSQIIDFKSGSPELVSEMEKEIRLREAQTMLHIAERFTAIWLRGFENLKPRNEAFFHKTFSDNLAFVGRVKFVGYRYFDMQTGKLSLEKVTMTPLERKDFLIWLAWFGNKVKKYKPELKILKDKNIRFKLRNIEFDRGKVDFTQ